MEGLDATFRSREREVYIALDHLKDVLKAASDANPASARVTIMNSTIVALVSVVEEGVRELAKDYLRFLKSSVPSYSHVENGIHARNIQCISDDIKNLGEKRAESDIKPIHDKLGTLCDGKDYPDISVDQFVLNRGNFRSK